MTARGAKVERTCKCGCGVKFMARKADVARGWGKFSSKSCKARWQEKRTGQHTAFINGPGRQVGIHHPAIELFHGPNAYETEQDYFSDNATGDHE